jgi:hypothetical protein
MIHVIYSYNDFCIAFYLTDSFTQSFFTSLLLNYIILISNQLFILLYSMQKVIILNNKKRQMTNIIFMIESHAYA